MNKVYGTKNLEASLHYQANLVASFDIETQGNSQLWVTELPAMAQLSYLNSSITVGDFNTYGKLHAVVAGNLYQPELEIPRKYASYVFTLLCKGDETFRALFLYDSRLLQTGMSSTFRKWKTRVNKKALPAFCRKSCPHVVYEI